MTREELIQELRRALDGAGALEFALLFGSWARGQARADSDVDVDEASLARHRARVALEHADAAPALERPSLCAAHRRARSTALTNAALLARKLAPLIEYAARARRRRPLSVQLLETTRRAPR